MNGQHQEGKMSAAPKTIEEHLEFLFSIVRLKLFFLARWQNTHPEEDFVSILRNRVDIFRKTDLNPEAQTPVGSYFDLPQWRKIEDRLHEIFLMVNKNEKMFEEWGFDLLRHHLENRCERDFYDRSNLSGCQCGFLKHEPNVIEKYPNTLAFHIINDCRPNSFFDDPQHIRDCFIQLLDITENHFHATRITTVTWLNSVPKWLELFPAEWQEHFGPLNYNVAWHGGFWGQFVTARGTFNEKAGAYLRETGHFRNYPRSAWCTTAAMREHITKLIK